MNRLATPFLATFVALSLTACMDTDIDDIDDAPPAPDTVAEMNGAHSEVAPDSHEVDVDNVLPFHTGHGPARGHEDITRFAVSMANDYISDYASYGFFPWVEEGVSGPSSTNPIVKGNYETDFPTAKMRAFYNAPNADWHNDERLANLHSTRNFPNGVWESANQACEGTKNTIAGATREAVRHMRAGNRSEAFYWIGHATHTIQDSFSTAHTQRNRNWKMTDVCTYGEEIAGACYHSFIDLDDRIWRSSWWCQLNPWDRSWSCLKEEAKLASLASAGYLIMMQWIMDGYITDVDASLNHFFEGNRYYPRSGYFTCNAL